MLERAACYFRFTVKAMPESSRTLVRDLTLGQAVTLAEHDRRWPRRRQ